MPQFLITPRSISNDRVQLTGREAHHVRDVFRLKDGDSINLFDGQGQGFVGRISQMSREGIWVDIKSHRSAAPRSEPCLVLALSVLPSQWMDMSILKATELGVDAIRPLRASHCQVKLTGDKLTAKIKRWEQITLAACKQSGRLRLPVMHEGVDIEHYPSPAERELGLVAHHDKSAPIKELMKGLKKPSTVHMAIGPEGGFTDAEIQTFIQKGFKKVNLGPDILRSETAALYMISMIKYAYLD
jgi:16S rRNA (uracil1498-N3)-methyltransferase